MFGCFKYFKIKTPLRPQIPFRCSLLSKFKVYLNTFIVGLKYKSILCSIINLVLPFGSVSNDIILSAFLGSNLMFNLLLNLFWNTIYVNRSAFMYYIIYHIQKKTTLFI